MNFLLSVLVLAIVPDVPLSERYPEADTVFHCTFDSSWDENFDGWPDKWTRCNLPGFPRYIAIQIDDEPSPAGERSLRFQMNGGAAAASSPPIKVGPLFSYVAEVYIKTEGLRHDRAYFSLTLFNEERDRVGIYYSRKVGGTQGWQKLRLGPISPQDSGVRLASLRLHVQPGEREDLRGGAVFADVWLGRLPRMALKSNKPYNFFTEDEKVEIRCTASGFLDKDPHVTFELEGVLGNKLAEVKRRMTTTAASVGSELSLDSFAEEPVGLIGKARWDPPIPGPGFYRVRVTMKGRKTLLHQRELNLVVVEPRHSPAGGEFGWTLPDGNKPLPLPMLSQLVGQAGINWLKYPLWYEEEGSREFVERLIAFGERLGAQEIELVGLLHSPPESLRLRFGQSQSEPLSVATIFSPDPEVWYPSLEPIMARLATQVRWWQLGDDTDTSFVGYPNLQGKIAQIKAELDRIGQDVSLGIGWGWLNELPQSRNAEPPWRSLALSADPPMTHQELSTYLDASKDTKLERWIVLQPLSKRDYSIEVRATDLVRRMTAAKIHGADAIFCPQPFSTQRGLMNDDGTPGELFLPWRTAALALGGAKYLGSIELPNGSPNQIFARDNDAIMVVWNEKPTEEVIYLGENVRQIDLWGHGVTPRQREHRQVIEVGKLPSFVIGINEPITRWRMSFAFLRQRIPSVFGRPHQNSFSVKNSFPRGARVQVELVMPKIWMVRPQQGTFRLAGGEELRRNFEVTLPFNASSGRKAVRVDFQVQGDRPYQFSVYRKMSVGLGDVYIEIATHLNDRGELEVEQRFVNETNTPVSFSCQLLAPGRRRQKTQILNLGSIRDVKTYHLSDGKELLGKGLWLRAEEMDGQRILNYRFVAEQ